MTIRVLIADDHPILRHGLAGLIALQTDMVAVGEATTGAEAVHKALAFRPDVLLLDLIMPDVDGIEVLRTLGQSLPDLKVLVLTSFAEDDQVFAAINAGALGYLLKDTPADELVQAIRDVHADRPVLHPDVARTVMRGPRPSAPDPALATLTERELDVLKLVAAGHDNRVIAVQLGISPRTVGTHVSNILQKLSLQNRTQAALLALRSGLASLN